MRPFEPLFRNPHLATIAGNFWSRPDSEGRWPSETLLVRTEPEVQILLRFQRPAGKPKGEIVLIHGLEGSSDAGYARSMAHAALTRGYSVVRFNMRSCGGTEHLALSNYHAGQTSDLLAVLRQRVPAGGPVFLVGYSLGGNVVLKLAGELQTQARELISGVCGVSVPIDLAACAAALEQPRNRIYQDRFLNRLKERIRRRYAQAPHLYTIEHLPKIRTIVDFDNFYTAKLFGFGTAANYFHTQSSNQFLERIAIPALIVQAKDDPLVPFSAFEHPAFSRNPNLELVAAEHGGHLGFISRRRPRFWLDEVIMSWVENVRNKLPSASVS
ncbi:MAG: alpha/beta fold hydrolase [Bryobacterales bacterium]|nr:alpha/beta fold hydrolase [Bryobacterales bacterium]MBV9401173.1 alpha/beta fold hydrolase [Bryobacterales bacterium]